MQLNDALVDRITQVLTDAYTLLDNLNQVMSLDGHAFCLIGLCFARPDIYVGGVATILARSELGRDILVQLVDKVKAYLPNN